MVSSKISLRLHVQMTSTHKPLVMPVLKIFMEMLVITLQYCVMFVLKECLVFGILLHHPPFDPAQKDGNSLAVQVEQITVRV
jgi:hypothetical protein